MNDWKRVVEVQSRPILSIAFRILGRVHEAEDVAQDVFCEAFQLQQRGCITDLPGILRRLATLRSLDRLRSRRVDVPITKDIVGSVGNPEDEVETSELIERLRLFIAELPERQAEILTLSCFEELSREEVAQCLQMSPEAVSSCLYKARRKIEQRLLSCSSEVNHEHERA